MLVRACLFIRMRGLFYNPDVATIALYEHHQKSVCNRVMINHYPIRSVSCLQFYYGNSECFTGKTNLMR